MDRLRSKRHVALLLLMVAGAMMGYAQSDCFQYEDEGNSVIAGLTGKGEDAKRLIIPATVAIVRSGAFQNANPNLTDLIVNDGNPEFENNLFGGAANTLTNIDMGSGMTVANMKALLTSLGAGGPQGMVVAGGFTGDADVSDATWSAVSWTGLSSITLPAELVAGQTFGSATVYGRFTIDKEIISYCTNATFYDEDNGSNMLFYVVNSFDGQYLHIQRVRYIAKGEGVLIHRVGNSAGYCDLRRMYVDPYTGTDATYYSSNMLVGVTTPTTIGKTDGDMTNLILKDGAFHPTSGGNIKANRAYLQIPTASLSTAGGRLEIAFADVTTGVVNEELRMKNEEFGVKNEELRMKNEEFASAEGYDLQGRRVANGRLLKGVYIVNGRKYIKH